MPFLNRRQVILGGAAAAAAAGAPAWAQAGSQLVIGLALEPPSLDPTTQASTAVSEVTWGNIFEGLTRFDEAGRIQPSLAQSWTEVGAKHYVFKLRPGAKFHNGKTLTSADVEAGFARNAAPTSTNKRKRVFANFEAVRAPDAQTVEVVLKKPSRLLPFFLAEATAAILPAEGAESANTKPVGTGPYRLAEWRRGDSVVLERFAGYAGVQKPEVARVVFRFIPDVNAQVTALKAGDVDYIPQLGILEAAEQLKADKRFTVVHGLSQGVLFLGMNNKRTPFDDVRVRQAISHALDRKAINRGAANGFGGAYGPQMSPINPYAIDISPQNTHDLALARKLLTDAGRGSGLQATLRILPEPILQQAAEIVASQLAQVNIAVKIEVMELGQWLNVAFKNKNYDMTILGHMEPWAILNYTDPAYIYQYDGAEFRSLMEEAEAAPSEQVFRERLLAAQRRLAQDLPSAWLFSVPKVGVARAGVSGAWKNSPVPENRVADLRLRK